jgi:hypothetical protein
LSSLRLIEAEKLLSRVFWNANDRWSTITHLRRVAATGLPHAEKVISEEDRNWSAEPFIQKMFEGQNLAALTKTKTATSLARARYSVDAASLVFAHSVLDALVYDYLRVTALADSSDWEQELIDKRLRFGDVKTTPITDLFESLLWDYMSNQIDHLSLAKKVDRLFAVCKPPSGWQSDVSSVAYTFDIERLRQLDELRNAVVHGPHTVVEMGNTDNNIFFLNMTMMHLLGLVKQRYGITVNPAYVFESG